MYCKIFVEVFWIYSGSIEAGFSVCGQAVDGLGEKYELCDYLL